MALSRVTQNFVNGVFRPDMFSKNVLVPFYREAMAPKITNSDYLGEITKGYGEKIFVRKRAAVSMKDGNINDPVVWEDVLDEEVSFELSYLKHVAAKISKIDKANSDVDPWPGVIESIKEDMKNVIDKAVIQGAYASAGETSDNGLSWLTAGNPAKDIALARVKLDDNHVPKAGRFLLLDNLSLAYLTLEDKLWADHSGMDKSAFITGQVGTLLGGIEVYSSDLITGSGTNGAEFNCYLGHRSAITLATKLQDIEFFPSLQNFHSSAGVTGTLVFGYGVVRPEALVHFKVQSAA